MELQLVAKEMTPIEKQKVIQAVGRNEWFHAASVFRTLRLCRKQKDGWEC